MSRLQKPDFAAANCRQLVASTQFRLGRKRLAEDAHLSARQLLSQSNHYCEVYDLGSQKQEIAATVRLVSRDNAGADTWALELLANWPPRADEVKPRPSETRGKPTGLLGRLGKLGLDVDFTVNAGFVVAADQIHAPVLPAPITDPNASAFSHIVSYTLAKISEFGQALYEVNIRSLGKGSVGLVVSFTYRRTLDHLIFEQMLKRAVEVRRFIERPRPSEAPNPPASPEAPSPGPGTASQPEAAQ